MIFLGEFSFLFFDSFISGEGLAFRPLPFRRIHPFGFCRVSDSARRRAFVYRPEGTQNSRVSPGWVKKLLMSQSWG